MTRPRPPLVIAICIYESLAALCILGSEAFSQFAFFAISPGAHRLHISPVHSVLVLLSALLSFGIAFALWNTSRGAFFLALMKLLISLFTTASVLYVFFSGHAQVAMNLAHNRAGLTVFWTTRFFNAAFLLIAAAIAVYSYRITMAAPSPSTPLERDIP